MLLGRLVAIVMIVLLCCISSKAGAEPVEEVSSEYNYDVTSVNHPMRHLLGNTSGLPTNTAAVVPPLRDPFSIPPALLQQMNTPGSSAGTSGSPGLANSSSSGFFTSQAVKRPMIKMRGIINRGDDTKPLALLEVDGGDVYMVRENDEISLEGGVGNYAIRVLEIDRLSVLVEVGTLGEKMRLR